MGGVQGVRSAMLACRPHAHGGLAWRERRRVRGAPHGTSGGALNDAGADHGPQSTPPLRPLPATEGRRGPPRARRRARAQSRTRRGAGAPITMGGGAAESGRAGTSTLTTAAAPPPPGGVRAAGDEGAQVLRGSSDEHWHRAHSSTESSPAAAAGASCCCCSAARLRLALWRQGSVTSTSKAAAPACPAATARGRGGLPR